MTLQKITREFYLKLSVCALAIAMACSTGLQSKPEPTPVPGSTTVFLVRHAEKVIANPGDPDPDISFIGRTRAQALASRLGASGVKAIIATQFKRTQQTAEPLARSIGLAPEIIRAGRVGDTDSAAAAVLRHRGEKILVVGHSFTIAPIIEALGGPHLQNLCENQYSDLFILYIPPTGDPQLVRQHYGNADPLPESGCSTQSVR